MIQLALIAAIITVIAIVAVSRLATASLSGVVRCWHSNAYFSLFSSLFFFDPPNSSVHGLVMQTCRQPAEINLLFQLLSVGAVRLCERLGVKFPGPTRHGERKEAEWKSVEQRVP